jgi:hypothetical protein
MRVSLLPLFFSAILFLSVGDSQAELLQKGSLRPQEQPPASAQIVKIGFYPISVHHMDVASNTYDIDTYIWFRWKGKIDPTKTIEFINMVEDWGGKVTFLQPAPKREPDGSLYQILRLEGLFTHPFSLSDYPLDRHPLSIRIEDQTYGIDRLAYVIDTKDSGVGDLVRIPGWNLTGWKAETFVHDYQTNFGDETTPEKYSMASFSIEISRPISFFFWKLLLPLFVVIIASTASLLIRPQLVGERAALPAGALLSAIFLQKSYSDYLPDLGYLVLMDKIYLIAYPVIILTLIRVIYAYLQVEDAKIARIRAVHRTDLRLLALLLAVSVVSAILIVWLR